MSQGFGCPLISELGAHFTQVRLPDGSFRLFLYQPEGKRSISPIESGIALLRCCGACLKCQDPEPNLAMHWLHPLLSAPGEYIGMETVGIGSPKAEV